MPLSRGFNPRAIFRVVRAFWALCEELKEVAEEIQECGFYIFPNLVPADICDALMDFALKEEATLAPPQNDCPPKACYQKDSPLAQGYRFAEQDLVQDHTIQRIATDISLLSLAQTYLQCAPVLSILALWWSTSKPSTDETQRQLAQWFHFDMDRIKWLKFFIHLTDVSSENGPHCFVKHSHRSGQKPRELLRRGYCRIPDEDMERHFPKQSFTEITGPKGTIFAADTRGFHKGKPVIKGDRLIFQIEFCDSLFGGDYWELPYPRHANPAFTAMIEKYPRIYSRFAA